MANIKLVSFDFDLTLTKHKTAMRHFSHYHNIADKITALDAEFTAGHINTHQFADTCAGFFKDLSHQDIADIMADLVLIDDCLQVIETLRQQNIKVIICSVGYRALIRPVAQKLDIDVFSGADLAEDKQIYSGQMSGYFSEYNKITFVQKYAIENGIELDEVMAVGDSGTDVPLFNVVGKAIAFNANATAKKHAHHIIDSQSLTPILNHIGS